MRTEERKKFIKRHEDLLLYPVADESGNVSDSLLVETMLNYGSLEDIRDLFEVMGIENVAKVFFEDIVPEKKRTNNYYLLTINYFTLFFNRYAH
jgi:hypothetical protein